MWEADYLLQLPSSTTGTSHHLDGCQTTNTVRYHTTRPSSAVTLLPLTDDDYTLVSTAPVERHQSPSVTTGCSLLMVPAA